MEDRCVCMCLYFWKLDDGEGVQAVFVGVHLLTAGLLVSHSLLFSCLFFLFGHPRYILLTLLLDPIVPCPVLLMLA